MKLLTVALALAGATAIAAPAAAVETENLPTLTRSRYVPGGTPVVEQTQPDHRQSKFASVRVKAEPFPCYGGELCIYEDTGGYGSQLYFIQSLVSHVDDLRTQECKGCPGENWNDNMSSFINRSGIVWWWYVHADGHGTHHNMNGTPATVAWDLPPGENDTASSIYSWR